MRSRLVFLLCLVVPWVMPARAAQGVYVPPELDPWVEWVAQAHPQRACPLDAASGEVSQCTWISGLELEVGEGLRFRMDVRTYSPADVVLPGDNSLRPVAVMADGEPVAVTGQDQPRVRLPAGSHRLTGEIRWAHRPAAITSPRQFGLLRLVVDGAAVAQPLVRNAAVVLTRTVAAVAEQAADTQTVDVFRLVRDDEPLRLHTEVHLDVAGRPRLITLGRALLEGFALLDF